MKKLNVLNLNCWKCLYSISQAGFDIFKNMTVRLYLIFSQLLKKYPLTYLLEWPKFRTLTTLNASEDVEQQECSIIIGRNTTTAQPL